MPLTTAALHTEITTDPAAIGYAPWLAAKDYDAVARILNQQNPAWVKKAPQIAMSDVLDWAAAGPIGAITDASTNVTSPVRNICLAALRMFNGTQVALDVSRTDVQNMLGALVSAGTITQAQHDALMNLQNITGASRAEVLFGAGVSVTGYDVERAA
ncbi:MAG: hypothetical protein LC772_06695 [Chloroflexi bacterium]|nr:hypothetical protein [Chloroflexota bacterium]